MVRNTWMTPNALLKQENFPFHNCWYVNSATLFLGDWRTLWLVCSQIFLAHPLPTWSIFKLYLNIYLMSVFALILELGCASSCSPESWMQCSDDAMNTLNCHWHIWHLFNQWFSGSIASSSPGNLDPLSQSLGVDLRGLCDLNASKDWRCLKWTVCM